MSVVLMTPVCVITPDAMLPVASSIDTSHESASQVYISILPVWTIGSLEDQRLQLDRIQASIQISTFIVVLD